MKITHEWDIQNYERGSFMLFYSATIIETDQIKERNSHKYIDVKGLI